ncbi:RDD family protein [Agromyces larvae]|uniref:RDD family protein n=1 Tax=Agromyces larvae TaxID=2929802 RepID=A0ABY4BXQ3_9MICO|nr:RDD family protein [Agromyces larvae]UOE43953.1 RDD family protein [Agromyces larvae]
MTAVTGTRAAAASTGRRLAAFTVDVVVVAVVGLIVGLATASAVLGQVAALQCVLAQWGLEARIGATVGKLLLRLRTTRDDRPYSPGAGRGFVRLCITGIGFAVGVVGAWIVVASGVWDPSGRRRSWTDRAAQTVVLAVPPRRRSAVGAAGPTHAMTGAPGVHRPGVVHADAALHGSVAGHGGPAASGRAAGVPPLPVGAPPGMIDALPARIDSAPAAPPPAPYSAPAVPAAPRAPYAAPAQTAAPGAARTATAPAPAHPVAAAQLPPDAPAAPDAPQTGVEGGLLLIFDTGQRAHLPLPVIANLGRNPAQSQSGDRLLTVHDPEGTVSKTHLRLEHSRGQVWVTDGGSTNGTEILGDDGALQRLAPGVRTLLEDGDRVRIGNRTFTLSLLLASDGEIR